MKTVLVTQEAKDRALQLQRIISSGIQGEFDQLRSTGNDLASGAIWKGDKADLFAGSIWPDVGRALDQMTTALVDIQTRVNRVLDDIFAAGN
jgi:hypothetical protein